MIDITTHEQQLVQEQLAQLIDALQRRQAIVAAALAMDWPNETYQPQKTAEDMRQFDGILAGLDIAITILTEWQPN